jgi:hypothetical protein
MVIQTVAAAGTVCGFAGLVVIGLDNSRERGADTQDGGAPWHRRVHTYGVRPDRSRPNRRCTSGRVRGAVGIAPVVGAPQLRHSRPQSRAVVGPFKAVDCEPRTSRFAGRTSRYHSSEAGFESR